MGSSAAHARRNGAPADGGENPGAIEPEPDSAAGVFGEAIGTARDFVGLLAGPGMERGLIGPRETNRLWSRHVLNCAVAAELCAPGARVVDIGSGAGLPGLAMALARPDLRIDLVESLLRRTTFLDEAVAALGLADRCRVVRARAEDAVAAVGDADVVTARAVAPLGKLSRWASPLLRIGGTLLALKGSSATEEIARDRRVLTKAGLGPAEVVTAGAGVLPEATTVVRAVRRK